MSDVVLLERRDRVLVITINRPEARNAVNAAVSHALAEAVDQLDSDDSLSVGVLTAPAATSARAWTSRRRRRRERGRAR